MIKMLLEDSSDPLTIFIKLLLETLQHVDQAQRQQDFSASHRRASIQLLAFLPGFQSNRRRAGPPQFLQVQEFFPASFASFGKGLRSGKASKESPGKGPGPIIEALQCQGIVLSQSCLKLVDQSRPLLNEHVLIPANQPQDRG